MGFLRGETLDPNPGGYGEHADGSTGDVPG
jgi:hypothetical protein